MKTYILALSLLLSQAVFAQSFTLLPNSASSNALNTTPNKVGINIGNPNYELHINRTGTVNTMAQFTNNTTNRGVGDGLLIGVNSEGDGVFNNQGSFPMTFSTNSIERMRIWPSGSFELSTNYLLSRAATNNKIDLISNNESSEFTLFAEFSVSSDRYLKFKIYDEQDTGGFGTVANSGSSIITNGSNSKWLAFRQLSPYPIVFANSTTSLMIVDINGKVGIGTLVNPTRNLDVNGDARIGTNGNTITAINNYDEETDLPPIAGNGSFTQFFTIPNIVKARNTVLVSPNVALTNGIIIAYARVSANDTIEVTFSNITSSSIDLPQTSFNFSVITFPMTL